MTLYPIIPPGLTTTDITFGSVIAITFVGCFCSFIYPAIYKQQNDIPGGKSVPP